MAVRNYLEPKRQREIAALAEALATKYSAGGRVNLERIAREAGIEFHYEDFPEAFDGVCAASPRGFVIICNTRRGARHSPRSRYTFAHELGHCFIPEHREKILSGEWPAALDSTDTPADLPEEKEADWFAANLVLPELAFRTAVENFPGSALEHVERHSQHFLASATACAYRLLGLNLLPAPAAVLRWDRSGRLISRRISDETAELRTTYRKLASAPPRKSVTAEAIASGTAGKSEGSIPAMQWFPDLSGYDLGDDAILTEEVMSLGQHGFLTVIHAREVHEEKSAPARKA